MARIVFSLLALSFALLMAGTAASGSSPSGLIKNSCKATRYPDLCVQSLSAYASAIQRNEHRLVLTSLSISLQKTRSVAAFVIKLSMSRGIKHGELLAVKDCIENMGDAVDRLSQSVRELDHIGRATGEEFLWHMSNVQTWVSAALTDQNTCLDGFAVRRMDGNVKSAITPRITQVTQVTSNALALVNCFAAN